ncbi:MAG: NAD(P)/FAD-dependent oxidoreductase [Candidatus Anstonellales archaeon]
MNVHIVGLGCSGSVAALSALRNGYEVYASEQEKKPGANTICTGLVSKETLEFLQKYIKTERIGLQRIKKAVFHFGKTKLEIKHREGAYVIDRKKMDFLLAKEAERRGATVEYGRRIERLSQYKSKNIIGADGANSVVAKNFGFPKIEKFVSAAIAKVNEEIIDKESVHLYFNEYTKGFFSWIVDQGKMQEVGCGVVLPNNVNAAFEKFTKEIGIKTRVEESAIIPIAVRRKTGMKKNGRNVLLVGDAAGHVKAFSGGGLAYGLRTAELSAQYIERPEGYEREWRRRYGLALTQFNVLQKINETLPTEMFNFGVNILKIFGIEKFLEKRKMDNPLGI